VNIEFIHEPGLKIEPADDTSSRLEIKHVNDNNTYISIPASDEFDETRWRASSGEATEVDITLRVERLWWAISQENKPPSEWKDRPMILCQDDLSAVSRKALWVRLPGERWCEGVWAGLDRSRSFYFPIKVSEDSVAIPLREFSDSDARNRPGITTLWVWMGDPQRPSRFSVGKLTVRWHCRICSKPIEETDLRDHASTHMEGFFRQLSFSELREYLPGLPIKIYLCQHCHLYVSEFESHRSTSAMAHHIVNECKKVDRRQGPTPVSFKIIEDVDEIRKNYDRYLPHIYRCTKCNEDFQNPIPDRLVTHLTEKHQNLLFWLQ
jgi:hypothetical protein